MGPELIQKQCGENSGVPVQSSTVLGGEGEPRPGVSSGVPERGSGTGRGERASEAREGTQWLARTVCAQCDSDRPTDEDISHNGSFGFGGNADSVEVIDLATSFDR